MIVRSLDCSIMSGCDARSYLISPNARHLPRRRGYGAHGFTRRNEATETTQRRNVRPAAGEAGRQRSARMACEHKRGFAKVCARAPFVLIAARVAGWSHATRSAPFRLCVFVSLCESVTSDPSDDSNVRQPSTLRTGSRRRIVRAAGTPGSLWRARACPSRRPAARAARRTKSSPRASRPRRPVPGTT